VNGESQQHLGNSLGNIRSVASLASRRLALIIYTQATPELCNHAQKTTWMQVVVLLDKQLSVAMREMKISKSS
jgi:hypothetical protein